MNFGNVVGLFVVLAMSQLGCNVPIQLQSNSSNLSEGANSARSNIAGTTTSPVTVRREDFLGCWSSGSGKVIRVTEKQILSSTNSFKPVNYEEVGFADDRLVLRLLDRPQFYYFQEIVSFEFDRNQDPEKGFPLVIRDYPSRDDFDRHISNGISGWVRFNCKEWFKEDQD